MPTAFDRNIPLLESIILQPPAETYLFTFDSFILWNYGMGSLRKKGQPKTFTDNNKLSINTSLIQALLLPLSFNLWEGKLKWPGAINLKIRQCSQP